MDILFQLIIFYFQILLGAILLYSSYSLFQLSKKMRMSERFEPYSVEILEDDNNSFFDILLSWYYKVRNNLSKKLMNLKIFDSYSLKYQKYIYKDKITALDRMNYISDKFFGGLIFVFTLFLSIIFRVKSVNIFLFIFTFLIGFFSLDIYWFIKDKWRYRNVERDLDKAIVIMNNAFKSGYSIMQAIYFVYTELDGYISDEFYKMYKDITFGLNMETVFKRFARRVKCPTANYMATSLAVVNKTGGDIVKVFSAVEQNSLLRKKIHDELDSISSSSRAMFKILIFIPIITVCMLIMLNPTYFAPLFSSVSGWICILLSLFIYVLYILIVKKIIYMEDTNGKW